MAACAVCLIPSAPPQGDPDWGVQTTDGVGNQNVGEAGRPHGL